MKHEGKHSEVPRARDLVGIAAGVDRGVEVIDWSAALEQCSGDASFLDELLVDLWNESTAHMKQLRICVPSGEMVDSQHEAHSIKGAAANLMCNRVRTAALYLEKAGRAGNKLPKGGSEWMVVKDAMQEGLELLERELVVFENVLKDKHLL